MTSETALFWVQEAIKIAIMVVGPLLLAGLIVGFLVSLFQALTSIQEMTLSYIPKMLVLVLLLVILSPWMMQLLITFTTKVFSFIPMISH